MPRITATTLRNLRPVDKDWFIRDSSQSGFQIKIPPSGKAVYQVEARLGGTGKVKKFKIGNVQDVSLGDARARATDALDKIRSGIDPLSVKRAQLHEGKTLRQLIELYFESRHLKERTKRDYKIIADRRFARWINTRVTNITKHEVRDWYAQGRNVPTQTEQAYKFLNSLMVFAMGLEIISQNPCSLVTNAGMRFSIRARTSHIEVNNDIGKFCKALTDLRFYRDSEKVARDIIVLILTTGLRSVEARTLRWSDIDFERKVIKIADTKNGRPHTVPMVPLTYSMLRYREENKEGSRYVFRMRGETKTGHIIDFQKTLSAICKKAEVSNVTPHDLRRTFATVLNSLNVGYADVKQLLNHKAQDITAGIYIQPDIEKLRSILGSVVNFYDSKIPFYALAQGCSQYTQGTLRFCLYNKGELTPVILDDPTEEDPGYIRQAEHDLWEN